VRRNALTSPPNTIGAFTRTGGREPSIGHGEQLDALVDDGVADEHDSRRRPERSRTAAPRPGRERQRRDVATGDDAPDERHGRGAAVDGRGEELEALVLERVCQEHDALRVRRDVERQKRHRSPAARRAAARRARSIARDGVELDHAVALLSAM
jgi:hypothetical protein